MLTIDQVRHIADLARLKLEPAEEEKFSKELSSILDYVSQLQEVDTSKIKPTSQVTGLENAMQADVVQAAQNQKELIEIAPAKEAGTVKVREVFK